MALFNKKAKGTGPPDQASQEQREAELIYREGIVTLRDLIAPPSLEIESSYVRIGKRYARTIYVYGYPRQIFTGWLSPIINLDEVIDLSLYIYPVESRVVLDNLKRKVGQLEATYTINQEKGRVRDPGLEAAIQDAEELRDKLQVGEERFFRFGLYLTMYANSLDDLNQMQRKIEQGPMIKNLTQAGKDPRQIATGIYLGILSRFPTEDELKAVEAYFGSGNVSKRDAAVDLVWSLINSAEFLYRH